MQECVAAFKWTLMNIYRNGDIVYVVHVMPDANTGPASGSIYYYPPDEPEVERCLVGYIYRRSNMPELGLKSRHCPPSSVWRHT